MKKLLLTTAACGLVMAAAPAHAEVELGIGGYTKMYGAFVDQDELVNQEVQDFDVIRNTEIHFTGETTLDNGLTVGFHTEAETDGNDGFNVDETYAYFSGGWGRINAGDEDGAGYLLQVAAPSADSNIDGIRQYVNPVNYAVLTGNATLTGNAPIGVDNSAGIDYDMDPTGKSTKVTYLSPIMNGFQVGLTFSPDTRTSGEAGVGADDVEDAIEETYEAAVRYEGQFNNVGVILGAGYSHGENGAETTVPAASDDRQVWNVGADFDIGPFGIGAIYREDNGARTGAAADDEETFVVGVDYTTGPFKLGASYYDQENTFAVDGAAAVDTQRYSGGVTYTYGPGMTFRGSIGHIEHELTGASDVDATYFTLGTQINF